MSFSNKKIQLVAILLATSPFLKLIIIFLKTNARKINFWIFLIEKCANFNKNSAQLNDGKKVFYYMKKYHFRSRLDFFFHNKRCHETKLIQVFSHVYCFA